MSEVEVLDREIKVLEDERDGILMALDDACLERAWKFCDFDVGDTVSGKAIGKATAVVENISHKRGSPVVLLTVTNVRDATHKFDHTVVGDEDAATLHRAGGQLT